MMRIVYLIVSLFVALPAYAGDVPEGYKEFAYPLTDGLALHGWNDESQEPLKQIGPRHYGTELTIVQDITAISATATHRITDARFRTVSSVAISGEGPTLTLGNIRSAPSAWQPLPVTAHGTHVSLEKIGLQGDVHLAADAQIEALHVTPAQIRRATASSAKEFGIDAAFWLTQAKACNGLGAPCSSYIRDIELELAISDGEPVRITVTHIPGC